MFFICSIFYFVLVLSIFGKWGVGMPNNEVLNFLIRTFWLFCWCCFVLVCVGAGFNWLWVCGVLTLFDFGLFVCGVSFIIAILCCMYFGVVWVFGVICLVVECVV